jgi:hypothetical protein
MLGDDTLLDVSDEQQQENNETKQDVDDDENEEDNLQEYYEIELNDDPTDDSTTHHNTSSEAQRRCKTCRVLFSTKDFAAHRLSHPTHFRAQKKLLFCCLCELDFKAGLAIKKPTPKNPPEKTPKNHLKNPTKNGFLGFYKIFNFL